ncbi:hypothetical protein ABMB67_000016 [Halalkalibacter oceani]
MDVDMLQSITQLHKYLIDYKWSILPTLVITERPDRVVKNLAEGKIILLDENSPTAMIIPSILFDFLSSMDDHYQQLAVRLILTSLRYLAFLISTFLPGLYILFVAYNPEITRIQLTLTSPERGCRFLSVCTEPITSPIFFSRGLRLRIPCTWNFSLLSG